MRGKGRWAGAILVCLLEMVSVRPGATESVGSTSSVTVTFPDFHSHRGRLRTSLYAHASGFPGDERKALVSRDVRLQGTNAITADGTVTITFDGLTPGEYAVSAYQDANGNGKLDTDRFGRPREDWGVSNDPRPLFRAPRFQEAKFLLKASENKVIPVSLRH